MKGARGYVDQIRINHRVIRRDAQDGAGLPMPGCLVVAVEHIVQAAAEYWVASPAATRRGFFFANIICRIIPNIPTLVIISDLNTGWTSGRVILLICSVSFQTSERSLWLSTVLNYAPPLS